MVTSIENLSPESKLWVYTSNRDLDTAEQESINEKILQFCEQWTAHSRDLKASGMVYMNRFVILMVDESLNDASGCSIDKSVHFLKELESEFNIRLFERDMIGIQQYERIVFKKLGELKQIANENTLICDPLVKTKDDFEKRFFVKIKDSWASRFI